MTQVPGLWSDSGILIGTLFTEMKRPNTDLGWFIFLSLWKVLASVFKANKQLSWQHRCSIISRPIVSRPGDGRLGAPAPRARSCLSTIQRTLSEYLLPIPSTPGHHPRRGGWLGVSGISKTISWYSPYGCRQPGLSILSMEGIDQDGDRKCDSIHLSSIYDIRTRTNVLLLTINPSMSSNRSFVLVEASTLE